ncbi:hypothetical protein [Streptomyces sp. CA2R106]|uniref:hypothetical protein n=1 Tax=Streptomyces sp. CA2R106 TaxID=3120153 RepID=UPI00300B9C19
MPARSVDAVSRAAVRVLPAGPRTARRAVGPAGPGAVRLLPGAPAPHARLPRIGSTDA